LNRLVSREVIVTGAEVESRMPQVTSERNRDKDKRRFTHDLGLFVLIPAQESDREKQNVDALLFLGSLRVPMNCQKPFP
jgi:hypothetical protein